MFKTFVSLLSGHASYIQYSLSMHEASFRSAVIMNTLHRTNFLCEYVAQLAPSTLRVTINGVRNIFDILNFHYKELNAT